MKPDPASLPKRIPAAAMRSEFANDDASYRLPNDLLRRYHLLLDKRFEGGLSNAEEQQLAAVSAQLDEADLSTPLEQMNADAATRDHNRRMDLLDHVIELLSSF
jgi:hypothetical protein